MRLSEEEARPDTTRAFLQRIVDDTCRRLSLDQSTPVHSNNGQLSIKDWLEKWLAGERNAISHKTYAKYVQIAKLFVRSTPNKPLGGISEGDITKFRDGLVASGLQPSTVNECVQKILKHGFKVAIDHGHISRNPVALVRPIKQRIKPVKGMFTAEQVQRVLATTPSQGDWHGLILGGYYTGQRIGDLAKLKWSAIDEGGGCLTLTQGKTARYRGTGGGTVRSHNRRATVSHDD